MIVRRSGRLGAAVALAAALVTPIASAADGALPVAPLLGAEAPAEHGWQPFGVRIRGHGSGISRGDLELTDGTGASVRAPFGVASGEQLLVELYAHDAVGKGLEVVARDAGGAVLARSHLPSLRSDSPLLVDLGRTARLEAALAGMHVPVHRAARAWAPMSGLELTVTHPAVEARSGELLLPDRGLGYSSATVVLVASDVLAALPDANAAALTDFVRAGGSLAVTFADDAWLTHPRLVSLLGGKTSLEAARELAGRLDFEVADPDSSSATGSYSTQSAAPAEGVAAKLRRVTGGRLSPTRWGASRELGLGEVHALAFDPTAPIFVDDPWVRRSVIDLVRQAWDRRALVGLSFDPAFDDIRTDGTRRLLDPNEGSRWSIWVSAIILVVYALLAGPLSFRRAARRGVPLRAFIELPIWSVGAAVLIVLVGAFAKGGRARARRLTFIECGADERRAAAVHFRAFFASSADSLRVTATDPSSLLDVAGGTQGVTRSLVLGRDTAELADLRGRPWETVLVREDGMTDLGGVVRFVGSGEALAVENALPRDLVAVVARSPGGDLRYFPRIKKGERVRLEAGRALPIPPSVAPAPLTPALPTPHRLESYRFAELVDADVKGSSEAWSAIDNAAREGTDFWPDDRPTLVGELEGGDGARRDADLAIDYDRVLLRAVGSAR